MRAIFLSDAHLRQPQDRNYQLLLEFLNRQKELDTLFLLGDIFEFWLGYEHLVFSAYVPLLEQLRHLRDQGTELYFVEGNHDFNMGPWFSETLACTIVTEERLIDWDGQKILICHGDLIKPDPNYRRLRAFWRSGFIRGLSRIVHPDLAWKFALWLSNKSSKLDPNRKHQDPSPFLSTYVANNMTAPADLLICGHFHYPVVAEHRGVKTVALGDWIHQFSYAEMTDGRIALKTFVP
ncbi:MAG: UDP-2,3-diacylglucosamine diphosphatase [Desulfuromonas sp.]|nr:MAG: UDP-2,3-diacylglucosamine diphosphatase [Desulfuromonas sp.]